MGRWVVVGFYHKLNLPYGCYKGPLSEMSALAALRSVIDHAHLNWAPDEQITVCAVVSGNGGLVHDFGLVKSDDPATWPVRMHEAV